jgi:alkanesulfonate monooxygenase SsuD/methylene tetrahydromethanopterin reductase-like flavin-dependent oxidoreductase (luciferase family)
MALKLGYKASAEQFAPRRLLEFSVIAEQSGFDSVFVSDHFQPWKHTDGHAPSALAWLGALGASTQRIVMGTSVLTPTFRYHPSVVAQAFGTLGSLFPGRYAGRAGDGFICTSGKKWELYTETLLPNVQEGLALSKRDTSNYDRMIEMKVSFDTDHRRALEDTRHWAALALTPEEKVTVHDPREMERLADALPIERAASRWIVSSDPDEHIEKIRPYIEIGFNHLVFHAPGPEQDRFLKLYGEMVLPKLRQRFG